MGEIGQGREEGRKEGGGGGCGGGGGEGVVVAETVATPGPNPGGESFPTTEYR